ncbi:helix-turn-helix domain-containing protein [Streptomyces iranensis]|uniref:Helix-turn-helix domain protein n=1 Tax=Streptomyces iranensis TaxID=576784 RepID=A0A060ZUY5_9ACTN|nr:helix-turn-helix transcriptional regulator [Streptomyces iranensis]MBP2068676.1 transcriptional regulator with XRE-family HTH domain [Streptomyces iranensis]CDR06867.1 helix-turn-helix domain protein [Streptomyces iranensis]
MDDRTINLLGDYLRARRELVRPADVGLPETARRRVPGLRREEVATLAGISVDYYLGLEQGRDRRPSAEILWALAQALRLDESATTHLFALANSVPRSRRHAHRHRVSPTLARLIDSWPATPAFVQTHTFLVLAANPLAQALSPAHTPGTNLVRTVFLEPDSFLVEPDPRQDFVACLRGLAGAEADDPDLAELVGEMSMRSESFRRLWARHDVGGRTHGRVTIAHPRVGTLTLDLERFPVPSAPGQQLVVYSAEADSRSHEALRLLAESAD